MPTQEEIEVLRREKLARAQAEQAAAREVLVAEKERRQAEAAKGSLAEFVRCIWPIVEPSQTLEWNWGLEAFCVHLEAVYRGQIKNLAIMTPAGTTKTIVVMQAFPAWCWAQDAGLRFLCCANVKDLATQSSMQCREIVVSPWFQKFFPHVAITSDQNLKNWFGTSARGFRKVGIVGSKVTGQKSDIMLIDDPNDADEVSSKVIRDAVINWYDNSCHDRVNNFMTSRRVIVAHRTHRQDLIGHCVANHGYEPLIITEEFEPARRYYTSIGWTDPRTEPGELLRPTRFGPEQVALAKKSPMWRTKHQQDPVDSEACVFKPGYFAHRWRYSATRPNVIVLDDGENKIEFDASQAPMFASCDAAADAKTSSDDTALAVFSVSPRGDLVWRHLYLEKLDIPDQPLLLERARREWPFSFIAIEVAGANRAMFQYAERLLIPCVPMQTVGDKLVRAQGAIIKASQGRIWLPEDGANPAFDVAACLNSLVYFTGKGKREKNDVADCLSHGVNAMPLVHQIGEYAVASVPVAVDPMAHSRFASPTGVGTGPRFGSTRPPTPTTVSDAAVSRLVPWS